MTAPKRPRAASSRSKALLAVRILGVWALVLSVPAAAPASALTAGFKPCGRVRVQGWLEGEKLTLHRGSRSETEIALAISPGEREKAALLEGLFVEAELEITEVLSSSRARARWLRGKVHVPGAPGSGPVKPDGGPPCSSKN